MAATQRSSAEGVEENQGKPPSPRAREHEDSTMMMMHGLPGGSSLFQKVMAELQPLPVPPPQPNSSAFKRRRNTQAKHVHYEPVAKVEDVNPAAQQQKLGKEAAKEGRQEKKGEKKEEEEEEQEEGGEAPETLILHGKCHCYFVQNGTVTGLADHECQHEHRTNPSSSPATSPRPSRRFVPSPSPPEGGSQKSKNKPHHPHHSRPSSSLHPPQPDEFRGRAHSDTTVMARLSNSRKASLAPSGAAASHGGKPVSRSQSHQGSPARGNRPSFPERIMQRRSSLRQGDDTCLAEGVAVSLSISSPPPIVVEDTATTGTASVSVPGADKTRVRKLSSHTIPSDQLHYLYDQFLHSGSGVTSGQRPYSATRASH